MRSTSAGISIAIHLAAVAILSVIGAQVARDAAPEKIRIVVPLTYPRLSDQPGGGGSHDPLPASKGRLPPPAIPRVFVPPLMTISNPKLAVSAALIDAPAIAVDMDQYGDPLGKAGIPSGGPGRGGGIGPGDGPGVGPGGEPRFGGDGARRAAAVIVRYSTPPRLLYKIEPEYPDEARKARYEGTVVLSIEVDTAGKPRDIRVMRGLGLGMDERAAEAVALWRFSPALERNKPVPAPVIVEVSFRLL